MKQTDAVEKKLIGWKMIGRYLDRTERCVQLWEQQRCLPIHRIPGGRNPTVYAYRAELDAWLAGAALVATDGANAAPVVVERTAERRSPGILVLPIETHDDLAAHCSVDALCQQLIVRMSAVQSLRVLSWTTSRSIARSGLSIDAIAASLDVRYIVESSVAKTPNGLEIGFQVIDTDFDRIMLADHFFVADGHCSSTLAELTDGVALHFALIHVGALVETMCLGGVSPRHFLDYLAGAQAFFDDGDGSTGRALMALDRLLDHEIDFAPARALRGLAVLQRADEWTDRTAIAQARAIFESCRDQPSARITTTFLRAAIARHTRDLDGLDRFLRKVMHGWVPSSTGSGMRLYERRSTTRVRTGAPGGDAASSSGRPNARAEDRGGSGSLVDVLLKLLVDARLRTSGDDGRSIARPSPSLQRRPAADASRPSRRDGDDAGN